MESINIDEYTEAKSGVDVTANLISEIIYNKSDLSVSNNKPLFYILNLLKNRHTDFDNEYISLVFKINSMITSIYFDFNTNHFSFDETEEIEVSISDVNEMLVFLSLDFKRIHEITDNETLEQLHTLFQKTIQDFIYLIPHYNYENAVLKLKKYNEVISNIMFHCTDYMKDFLDRKASFYKSFYEKYHYIDCVEDERLNLEQLLFLMTIEIFVMNIRTLNYQYSTISDAMVQIRDYIEDNYMYLMNNSISIDDIHDYILSLFLTLKEMKFLSKHWQYFLKCYNEYIDLYLL